MRRGLRIVHVPWISYGSAGTGSSSTPCFARSGQANARSQRAKRWKPLLIACGALLAIASCDQNKSSRSSQGASNSTQGTTGGSADDETAALAVQQFTTPIFMHMGPDGYAQEQKLVSMNGVDPRPLYGASYAANDFVPCTLGPSVQLSPAFFVRIDEYSVNDTVVFNWLVNHQLLRGGTHTVSYPNATQASAFGSSNTYTCPIVSDSMFQYLPTEVQSRTVHGMIDVPLLRRVFQSWTYENRYDTEIPGRGSVKMFAGTFSYTMQGVLPGVSSTGVGTASVKMMLNPDNGQWTAVSFEQHDVSIGLN
jgi:hypothetical protein